MFRVTGTVVRLDRRSGSKNGRDWAFDVIRVLVKSQAVVEITRFTDSRVPLPAVGTEVDWAVEVSARGNYLSCSLDSVWDDAKQPALAGK